MSTFDMEIGPVSPAISPTGNDDFGDVRTIRRLVIVAAVFAFALSATMFGIALEEQGFWSYGQDISSVQIVLD